MQAAALGNWEGGSVIRTRRDTEGGTGLDLGIPEAWMTALLHQTPLFLQAFHHLYPLQELAKAAAPLCSPHLCSLLALSFAWVIPPPTLCLSFNVTSSVVSMTPGKVVTARSSPSFFSLSPPQLY